MHDHVYGTVFQQKFAALKSLWQFHTNRLTNHIRAGESHQRIGFGDVDITHHRQAGGNAAIYRIDQH